MAILIDSTVLIDIERQRRSLDGLSGIADSGPLFVAAVSVSELLVGVYRAATTERARSRAAFVEDVVSRFTIVPFDLAIARIYGRITADLMASGQVVGAHDMQIAATAIAHGYWVLTHNLRDFQRIPGLDVQRM